jgi:caspase domain-containing protein
VIGLFAVLALIPAAAAQEPPAEVYAVIVANNKSLDAATPSLQYADDDGARYRELLSLGAKRVELLTVLDPDTQRVYPEAAHVARAPVRAELQSALESVFEDVRRASTSGARTVFYFIYAGHGSVGQDGEGELQLLDGRFTRSDLFHEVIAKSPARINHVIIDACNAYLMVARRGESKSALSEDRIRSAVSGFVGKEGLDRYPNTGVLLSTSRAAEVHEWARFEAGVFSHEVRSAMSGGADIDGDRRVSYDEARAFISAANAKVADPKAKLSAFVVPPALDRSAPLFDLARLGAPTVRIGPELKGRRYLEDARGVRYADLNVGADGGATVSLVPSSVYFLRSDTEEVKIPLEAVHDVDASRLPWTWVELAQRGSAAITFQRDLFGVPFGRSYVEGYLASLPNDPTTALIGPAVESAPFPVRRTVALAAAGGAAAALATGLVYGLRASSLASDYRSAIGANEAVQRLATDSDNAARVADVLYVTGGVLLAAAGVLWFWPESDE